ncbi:6-phosphofructokinase [Orenia metallireducens]|uniref:6-phosphofructokinase n=1 Tax=Orenia metallireducens TaxID=1413210 RepID=A0A285FYG4_9FIRM|nr:ATP-dependent 6-phosphofructokinase [Orenia metallireducens]PRX35541.1 6-phosphofructokinase [Orenia metallireducens]SNY16133.1 6-phosphofructokinase [Orenia metallireducens]
MQRIGVLTSGGDAPGMNATLRAVVKAGTYHNLEVLGIEAGYIGLLEKRYRKLEILDVEEIVSYGGTIIKTGRTKEFQSETGFKKALANIKNLELDGLVVIGGNGSMKGAQKLVDAGVKVIGVPGTIDNDITGTDYAIGFDTACNIVTETVDRILDTATSLVGDTPRVFVIEVMGRHSGEIAMNSTLAGSVDGLLIPELEIDYDEVADNLKRKFEIGKNYGIILMAEGVGKVDDISRELEMRLGYKIRETLLGHQQRGGRPTFFDRVLASKLGAEAVNQLVKGENAKMVGIKNNKVEVTDLKVVNNSDKEFNDKDYKLNRILCY